MPTYIREPQDVADYELLANDWAFVGVGLFTHPKFKHRNFTKDQAITEAVSMLQTKIDNLVGVVGDAELHQA